MNDQTDNGSRTLRDRFPIYRAVCGEKIGKGERYHITDIKRGNGDKALAENVYQHVDCQGEAR